MLFKGHLATCMLAGPLVVELVDKQDAVFVAEFDEITAVGIMRGTDVVHAKLLDQFQPFLDGLGVGSRSQSTQCVVVGVALQQHFLAVKLHAEVRPELDGTDAECFASLIGHSPVFAQQLSFYSI